jgi:hypothetical protein
MHTWRTPALPAILLNLIAVLYGSAGIASAKETLVTGTAFAVTSSGILVTNAHVVEGCSSVLTLYHGDKTIGEVVARDTEADLALISIRRSTTPLKLRALPALKLGESAIVYGFPLFGTLSTGGNLTIGNVSGLLGIEDDPNNIQISAPVQPGNSGGAVLDESGHVIAVVVARYGDVSSQNVNFAISLDTLKNFLAQNGISFEANFSLSKLSTTQIGDIGQNASHLVACLQSEPQTTVREPQLPQAQPTPHVVQVPDSELKISEIRRPYALIAPDHCDITVSNIGTHVLIEAMLGYSRTPQRYCSPDLRTYDGLKRLKFRIEPGDSVKLSEDLISDAEWFCVLKVYGFSAAPDPWADLDAKYPASTSAAPQDRAELPQGFTLDAPSAQSGNQIVANPFAKPMPSPPQAQHGPWEDYAGRGELTGETGEQVAEQPAAEPELPTPAAKKAWDDFEKSLEGQTIVAKSRTR